MDGPGALAKHASAGWGALSQHPRVTADTRSKMIDLGMNILVHIITEECGKMTEFQALMKKWRGNVDRALI